MITSHGQRVSIVPKLTPGTATGRWRVRWRVDGRPFERTLGPKPVAKAFQAQLQAAVVSEVFDARTGLPLSMSGEGLNPDRPTLASWAFQWFAEQHERSLAGTGWAPKTAATHMQSLQTILPAVTSEPATGELLKACRAWIAAQDPACTVESSPSEERAGAWLLRNSLFLDDVDADVIERLALPAIRTKLPPKPKPGAAPSDDTVASLGTVRIRRSTLSALLRDAHQRGLIERIPNLTPGRQGKAKAPAAITAIDDRTVPSAERYREWIDAVADSAPERRRLRAFYCFTLYTGARPAEVSGLRVDDLELNGAAPVAVLSRTVKSIRRGKQTVIVEGPLKHRSLAATRTVPIPGPLVALLREHLADFPPGRSGWVFRSSTGGLLSTNSHRMYSVGAESMGWGDPAHPLHGTTHYTGRHVYITTMINAGTEVARVAALCGNSVDVIRKRYESVVEKSRPQV